MISFPNAKINIGLNVTEKRADGFHNIESVFYPVPFADILEVIPAKRSNLQQSGLLADLPKEDNLVWKALKLIEERTKTKKAAAIYLHKIIPAGAGLGGGSADAAFLLKTYNQLLKCGLTIVELEKLSAEIGSDCPFFVENKVKYVFGRGDEMLDCKLDLSGYYLKIVIPDIFVSTAEAYANVNPKPAEFSLKNITDISIHKWKNKISNDFEAYVFKRWPQTKKIKEKLYSEGAFFASMSGSGSAFFALYEEEPDNHSAIKNDFVYITKL